MNPPIPGIVPTGTRSYAVLARAADFPLSPGFADVTGWTVVIQQGSDFEIDTATGVLTAINEGGYVSICTSSLVPGPSAANGEIRLVSKTGLDPFTERVVQPLDDSSTATCAFPGTLIPGDQVKVQAQKGGGPGTSLLADSTKFIVFRVR